VISELRCRIVDIKEFIASLFDGRSIWDRERNRRRGLYILSRGGSSPRKPMTKLLDRAIETARGLPPEMQDDIARVVLQLAGTTEGVMVLTPEEKDSLAKSRAEAQRREFATDEEVRATWAKHGL
jgi:hypothetical protein